MAAHRYFAGLSRNTFLLAFALTRNVALIGLLFVLYGLYQGIFRSVGKALASDYVPKQLRASGVGWYNTIVGVSGLAASLIAGWLWNQAGHTTVFFLVPLSPWLAVSHC